MHRIGYLLADGFQMMGLANQTVYELANRALGQPFYTVQCHSLQGGLLSPTFGPAIQTRALSARSRADTWMVPGVIDPLGQPADPQLVQRLRQLAPHARRTVGLCTGAFVLADAGLLEGRRATTHWGFADALQRRHPGIAVEPDRLHIVDGPIWTSAGMTAALDLALAMVEKDLGAEVARRVAHSLVMHQQRSGGQSQHSEMLKLAPKSDRIQRVLEHVRGHLAQPLGVEELAEVANLSPRQFSRVFVAETGQSPAKAIEGLRLEAARLMIEKSRHPLEVVARENGFRDRRHLREAFLRGFGVPPRAARSEGRKAG
ncbi:GlxA family transcriptional regulator [Stenotrophomonas sp. 24(2023)]|uniref:GlxA family transcriptional regulator n=1 Tax=Stenotrophomonas sp. 24(2023) TaxID=3068324 RepID=UPI0027DF400C|nr:GlxA family transcriptional regulator [Stenotrophomonas sp. 24(2023)]WMJ69682.1 GlxA family transcriptional regulator [Stenotrophomonas sp. 24(2023)]